MYPVSLYLIIHIYLNIYFGNTIGAQSFNDLKTVDQVLYQTFKDACIARGLLEDNAEWRQCLREACEMQTGPIYRQLFATILLHCSPNAPEQLWEEFKQSLCDDFLRPVLHIPAAQAYNQGLHHINRILLNSNKTLEDFPHMPIPGGPDPGNPGHGAQNHLLAEQLNYDHATLTQIVAHNVQQLNEEQQIVYNAVLNPINNNQGHLACTVTAGVEIWYNPDPS